MSVVMLAGAGDSSWMVANLLKDRIPLEAIIVEQGLSQWNIAKRRALRFGWRRVLGQILFYAYAKVLQLLSSRRIRQLIAENGLVAEPPGDVRIIHVESANDPRTIGILRSLAPKVVVVNGTQILSKDLLDSVDAVFINMHAGITPKYRGVHGGYWALANGDEKNAGVTVHFVDTGIDTGKVLYQAPITPQASDNFCTYPLLQLIAGVPILLQAVLDALAGQARALAPDLPSRLYSHPTIWEYVRLRITRGVR